MAQLTQPMALDGTLTQPTVLDGTLTQHTALDGTLTQPTAIDVSYLKENEGHKNKSDNKMSLASSIN